MLTCPNCGEENRSEALFCRSCGETLPVVDENVAAQLDFDQAAEPVSETRLASLPPSELAPPGEANPPEGQVLNGRFRIQRQLPDTGDCQKFEAIDLLRCPVCAAIQSELQAYFCENCGSSLAHKPLVILKVEQASGEAVVEGDDFKENEVLYRVERGDEPQPATEGAVRIRLKIGYQSHPGSVRDNNEDSLVVLHLAGMFHDLAPAMGFFAIADGVGGAAAGEVASQSAVRCMAEGALTKLFVQEVSGRLVPPPDLSAIMKDLAISANQAILDILSQAQEDDMGATLTAALILDAQAVVANVGDSRTYHFQQGKLNLVTHDHSLVARLVEHGVIQPDEVYAHDQRSIIYRSLGGGSELEVDIFPLALVPGDRLLLCSDGLWEMVRDSMIEEILLERQEPQAACDRLVELANLAGGQDNISVVVIDVQD